jgi:hypothetical protein
VGNKTNAQSNRETSQNISVRRLDHKVVKADFGTLYAAIYRTIILPVVLYGCETWSLVLREKRRVRVFVNRFWGEYLDLRGTR